MSEETENDWRIACSDDELYNPAKLNPRIWQPLPEDIIKLYEEIAEKGILQIEWQCPGRRRPVESQENESEEDYSEDSADVPEQHSSKPPTPTEFDFDDTAVDLKMTPRRTPGSAKPKGSAQKRVASLDKVMFDILRHKKMEEQEKRETVAHKAVIPENVSQVGDAVQKPNLESYAFCD